MATQSDFYSTDGSTQTFPSTKHIATKTHMAVYLRTIVNDIDELLDVDEFELINNAAVLAVSPDPEVYKHIEVKVADTPDGLGIGVTNDITDRQHTWDKPQIARVEVVAFSVAIELDMSDIPIGEITLTGNTTLSADNLTDAQEGTLRVIQAGAGGYSIADDGQVSTKIIGPGIPGVVLGDINLYSFHTVAGVVCFNFAGTLVGGAL